MLMKTRIGCEQRLEFKNLIISQDQNIHNLLSSQRQICGRSKCFNTVYSNMHEYKGVENIFIDLDEMTIAAHYLQIVFSKINHRAKFVYLYSDKNTLNEFIGEVASLGFSFEILAKDCKKFESQIAGRIESVVQ